jgi:hypothetical protein
MTRQDVIFLAAILGAAASAVYIWDVVQRQKKGGAV